MNQINNLVIYNFFEYHILIWLNTRSEFKYLRIDNRMYKKYSLYIGSFIFEIGKLKKWKKQ
jgi:hypothetical protein